MSGHSKWANIKHKKGKSDAQKAKVFTKLGRELLMAVKQGGPDPAGNAKLRDVIAKCKSNNMPNDTINNAIKRAADEILTLPLYADLSLDVIEEIVDVITRIAR